MNRQIGITTVFALLPCFTQAAVLLQEDFEDNVVSFTSSAGLFHDGGSDYFTIVPLNGPVNPVDSYSGFSGNHYFAAEDIDDGNTRPGTQTLSFNVNITGFENITFGTLFAVGGNGASTPSYDSNDGFLVRARVDAGAFQNLLAFESTGTTNFVTRQDTDFDGVGDGFLPDSSAVLFNGLGIVGTGDNLLLEIIVSSNDANTEYAFDNVTITGDSLAVPEPSRALFGLAGVFGMTLYRRRR